ncbi:MAG: hypothetical protein ACRDWT_01610 [Jatrophihabitantaceae bacterium]
MSAHTEAYRKSTGLAQPAVDFDLGDDSRGAATVGIIYDEIEGLTVLADFDQVRTVLTDPGLATKPMYRRAVLGYLRDESVSTLPFRRFAAEDPERVSRVFAHLLNKPKVRWERDGEALLRTYKPRHVDRQPCPQIVPLGGALARALHAA